MSASPQWLAQPVAREGRQTRHSLIGMAVENYFKFPQNRWMRRHASSRSSVLVAYEMRNAGPKPNGVPCTTATPSASNSSVTNSSSFVIFLPDGAVLPIVPAQDG